MDQIDFYINLSNMSLFKPPLKKHLDVNIYSKSYFFGNSIQMFVYEIQTTKDLVSNSSTRISIVFSCIEHDFNFSFF